MRTESKSKTFQKDSDFSEVAEWALNQFETTDFQPEGTNMSGGEPSPYDPECTLNHKYIVTVTKVIQMTYR